MSNPDFNELLDVSIPHAQDLLKKHGEFYPFGAWVRQDGTIELTAGYSGDEHPQSQELIDLLLAGYRQKAEAGEIRAVGICLDMRIALPGETEKSDAICTQFESQSGEAVDVFMPYRKKLLGRYEYGNLIAQRGAYRVFGGDS